MAMLQHSLRHGIWGVAKCIGLWKIRSQAQAVQLHDGAARMQCALAFLVEGRQHAAISQLSRVGYHLAKGDLGLRITEWKLKALSTMSYELGSMKGVLAARLKVKYILVRSVLSLII